MIETRNFELALASSLLLYPWVNLRLSPKNWELLPDREGPLRIFWSPASAGIELKEQLRDRMHLTESGMKLQMFGTRNFEIVLANSPLVCPL